MQVMLNYSMLIIRRRWFTVILSLQNRLFIIVLYYQYNYLASKNDKVYESWKESKQKTSFQYEVIWFVCLTMEMYLLFYNFQHKLSNIDAFRSQKIIKSSIFINNETFIKKERRHLIIIIIFLMDEECPICRMLFDFAKHTPMSICPEQHLCCSECINQIFSHHKQPTCPECRFPLRRKLVKKFRHFEMFYQKIRQCKKEIQENNQQMIMCREMYEVKLDNLMLHKEMEESRYKSKLQHLQSKYTNTIRIQSQLIDQIIHANHEENGKNFRAFIREKAKILLEQQNYKIAFLLLTSTIEKYPNNFDDVFLGLGSKQEQFQFCEDKDFKWYKDHHNIEFCLQDMLAIIFLKRPNHEEQKQWYSKMALKHPENMRIQLGLAFTCHNQGDILGAFNIYLTILQKEFLVEKIYLMLSFIYLDNKQFTFAHQYSNRCLMIQPRNIYALYVSALSNGQKPQQAQIQLIKALLHEPTYTRARKALIQSFQSQIQKQLTNIIQRHINQVFEDTTQSGMVLLSQAITHYYKENLQQSKQVLLKLAKSKDAMQILHESQKLLGGIYFMQKQYEKASVCFHVTYVQSEIWLCAGICYYFKKDFQRTVKFLKYYLQFLKEQQQLKRQSKFTTVLFKILFYSLRKINHHSYANIYYKSWIQMFYKQRKIVESQMALHLWEKIFDVNRSNKTTKEILQNFKLIEDYYSSVCFHWDLING